MSHTGHLRYGHVQDTSTADYVECIQCRRRYVGGTFMSRVERWASHAQASDCHSAKARRNQEREQHPSA